MFLRRLLPSSTLLLAASLAMPLAAAPVAPPTGDAGAPAVHADVHGFTIGSLQAHVLRDGGFTFPNDGSVLAMGEPKEAVDALLTAAGEPTDPVRLSLQGLLVVAGDRVMLFDTGGAPDPAGSTGRLPKSLETAGIAPGRVTDILISHAHGDHVGGLLDGDGALRFPEATIRLAAPEWEALKADSRRAKLVETIAPRVETFERGTEVLPGVTSVEVAGHTPGHTAYDIVDGDARLLYIGDTAHHHIVSVQRPHWTIQFDRDAPTAEASREALLERAADEGLLLQSPHFPFPGLGHVERRDGGFAWVPLR